MQWRIDMEWAWQEVNRRGRRLLDCVLAAQGKAPISDPSIIKDGDMVLVTVDEMAQAEILFKTGLVVK